LGSTIPIAFDPAQMALLEPPSGLTMVKSVGGRRVEIWELDFPVAATTLAEVGFAAVTRLAAANVVSTVAGALDVALCKPPTRDWMA